MFCNGTGFHVPQAGPENDTRGGQGVGAHGYSPCDVTRAFILTQRLYNCPRTPVVPALSHRGPEPASASHIHRRDRQDQWQTDVALLVFFSISEWLEASTHEEPLVPVIMTFLRKQLLNNSESHLSTPHWLCLEIPFPKGWKVKYPQGQGGCG